jgi:hypothetical protein
VTIKGELGILISSIQAHFKKRFVEKQGCHFGHNHQVHIGPTLFGVTYRALEHRTHIPFENFTFQNPLHNSEMSMWPAKTMLSKLAFFFKPISKLLKRVNAYSIKTNSSKEFNKDGLFYLRDA